MNRTLYKLVGSQFFSSLADNMGYFLIAASAVKYVLGDKDELTAQAMMVYFLIYVILSPWAGNLAERFPKGKIFVLANGFKVLFFLGIILKMSPVWSYGFFGIGSVLYSPAKYGILPSFLKDEKSLMTGNAWLEGSTTIAVILGTVSGGILSDQSIGLTAVISLVCLGLGSGLALLLPDTPTQNISVLKAGLGNFIRDIRFLLTDKRGGAFSVFGSVVFWMGLRVLQTFLLLWIPFTFGLQDNTTVGILTGITAIGTICGALASPYLLSYWQGSRLIVTGVAMGIGIMGMSLITDIYLLGAVLFVTGILAGLYMIPINALNEHVGERNMGAGRSVSVQNFMENLCTSGAMVGYVFLRDLGVAPRTLAWGIGGVFIILILTLIPIRTRKHYNDEI